MSERPRSFEQWIKTLPPSLTSSPVWQMGVYREAAFLLELVWHDTRKLIPHEDMLPIRRQIFHAVGSIGANIAEVLGVIQQMTADVFMNTPLHLVMRRNFGI